MTYRELHQACASRFGSEPVDYRTFRAFVAEQVGGSIYTVLPSIRHMSESEMIRWTSGQAGAPIVVNPLSR